MDISNYKYKYPSISPVCTNSFWLSNTFGQQRGPFSCKYIIGQAMYSTFVPDFMYALNISVFIIPSSGIRALRYIGGWVICINQHNSTHRSAKWVVFGNLFLGPVVFFWLSIGGVNIFSMSFFFKTVPSLEKISYLCCKKSLIADIEFFFVLRLLNSSVCLNKLAGSSFEPCSATYMSLICMTVKPLQRLERLVSFTSSSSSSHGFVSDLSDTDGRNFSFLVISRIILLRITWNF